MAYSNRTKVESVASPHFSGIAEVVVPETATMTEKQWSEFYSVINTALARRPAKMRRQLKLFIRILNVISLVRYRRSLPNTTKRQRVELLSSVEDSRLLLFRKGFWGIRTLVYMGYYAHADNAVALGYRASPRGWESRR